eukprot:2598324-Amphidinium_carterae.1
MVKPDAANGFPKAALGVETGVTPASNHSDACHVQHWTHHHEQNMTNGGFVSIRHCINLASISWTPFTYPTKQFQDTEGFLHTVSK